MFFLETIIFDISSHVVENANSNGWEMAVHVHRENCDMSTFFEHLIITVTELLFMV